MKAKELREMTVAELEAKFKELKGELFNLRFQHAINQLDNPHKIVEVKRDIARVMTVLRQKEAEASKNA
ncbi:MAG: 50S ribosomal protein L29 [Clostridia bacterium]|mgnify:CR=1 FL=1|nr:50S ribosomal protein L29 [Clostridia bacterium]